MIDCMISIRPIFVDLILSGEKRIEIRRRPMRLPTGSRLWIYSTLPRGRIDVMATVAATVIDNPIVIWNHYSDRIGISQETFLNYVAKSDRITAILLDSVVSLVPPLELSELKTIARGFQPPQFAKHLKHGSAIENLLSKRIPRIEGTVGQSE